MLRQGRYVQVGFRFTHTLAELLDRPAGVTQVLDDHLDGARLVDCRA